MATLTQEPVTRPALIHPGAALGCAPTRAAKALIAVGLGQLGIAATYLVQTDFSYQIVTDRWEMSNHVQAARAFVAGALLALYPPGALDQEVVTCHTLYSSDGRGEAIPMWGFICAHPQCVVVSTVRHGDRERAAGNVAYHGWRHDDDHGWLCPDHAKEAVTP